MLEVVTPNHNLISDISIISERNQLPYHEYNCIQDEDLRKYFFNKTLKILNTNDSFSFVLIDNRKIKGFISISKDQFDSEIFGFNCYRIIDLILFSQDLSEIKILVFKLIDAIEIAISQNSTKNYIFYSLNNNVINSNFIFDSIVRNGFYFIHTLLTFNSLCYNEEVKSFYPEQNLIIRTAHENDIKQITELSNKSFQYSRFLMDPYLDKEKSNSLLKISAENSILKGFIDIMFVAELNGKIVGYYSGKKRKIEEFNKTIGEATISVIDVDHRGMGLFSKLDCHLLKWFSDNTDFSEMGTYLANYPVHKTWISKNLSLIRGSYQFSRLFS